MFTASIIRRRAAQALTILAAMIIFGFGFAMGSLTSTRAAQDSPGHTEASFDYFWQAFRLIREQYIEDVPVETLVEGATKGMLEALNDQFSGYMPPDLFKMLNEELEGEIQGIGVVIRTDENTGHIVVVSVMNGTPAQAAGILPGDVFAAVNGEDAFGMSQMELAAKVRGAEGTSVQITMLRGDQLIDFVIQRARIVIPNVEYEVLDGDIAYVRLNQFTVNARAELESAINDMQIDARRGLIIDFRDNPGGLLSSAVDVASLLLDGGVVTYEEFGSGREQVFNATGRPLNLTIPVVLLVNEGSASGSELVAGAWQDRAAATIIGEPTFGKGTVQTWHELTNGGGLRLTIARWLTPNRRSIHGDGITPDIVVDWTPTSYQSEDDPQLAAALEYIQSIAAEPTKAAN
jgi:carboxyl-terminal processing protease